jgi:transposase-like protein
MHYSSHQEYVPVVRLASRADHDAIKRDLKEIDTAPTADAALFALDELDEKWGKKYRAIIRLWRKAWTEFVPFMDYDVEIRRVICSTDEIVNPIRWLSSVVALDPCSSAAAGAA